MDGHWADSEAGGHLGWGFKTEVWRGPSLASTGWGTNVCPCSLRRPPALLHCAGGRPGWLGASKGAELQRDGLSEGCGGASWVCLCCLGGAWTPSGLLTPAVQRPLPADLTQAWPPGAETCIPRPLIYLCVPAVSPRRVSRHCWGWFPEGHVYRVVVTLTAVSFIQGFRWPREFAFVQQWVPFLTSGETETDSV